MSEADVMTFDIILVGVDGSDASVSSLDWACHLAATTAASVEAVTTWQWPMPLGPAAPMPVDYQPGDDARTMLEGIVRTVAERYPTVPVRARVVEGHAAEALVEATRHADLLVVGSRGHGAFAGMLLGSVSQHCASHAHCPVVIYRDRDDRDEPESARRRDEHP